MPIDLQPNLDFLQQGTLPSQQAQVPEQPMIGLGGQQSPLQQGPPSSPEELETRKQGWRGFFERLKTDKGLQQMFLTMGAQLMQPIKPNQSFAGHLGSAVQAGDVAKRSQDALSAQGAFKTRELDIKQQTADASTKAAGAKGTKLPAAEVQVLQMLTEAKVQQAKVEGRVLSPQDALLEAEKDRRTKGPAELLSVILPFLSLIPDPKERTAMLQRALESLKVIQGQGAEDLGGKGTKAKRQVWDKEQQKFVEK